MTINLTKGNSINLSKEAPGLSKLGIGVGWAENKMAPFDLDVSAFVLRAAAAGEQTNKLISDQHFIFFNNLKSPNMEVVHSGDNRTGAGAGDDETLMVDLSKVHADAVEISFVLTIFEAAQRNQNLGQVKDSYIRVYNPDTGAEIAKYMLEDEFKTETGVQIGSLFKNNGQWEFRAIGAGHHRDLGAFVGAYQA